MKHFTKVKINAFFLVVTSVIELVFCKVASCRPTTFAKYRLQQKGLMSEKNCLAFHHYESVGNKAQGRLLK